MESIEFLPVEVTKPFMSLTVGDVLRVNVRTGRYELRTESEEIGVDSNYSEKYEISLEPWIIEKYSDHFEVYDETKYEKEKYPLTPEEADECPCDLPADCEQPDAVDTITELRQVLAEAKGLFAEISAKLEE